MDTPEESVTSVRDMLAELMFLAIEANQEFTQVVRKKVSLIEMAVFMTKMDQHLKELEEQLQLVKKLQELKPERRAERFAEEIASALGMTGS